LTYRKMRLTPVAQDLYSAVPEGAIHNMHIISKYPQKFLP
jgi:hypothetical protein